MNKLSNKFALPFAFLLSVAATAGSLYFSEVLKLPPCVLCWYQRIAMYPLVAILLVGMLLNDKRVHYYAYPFAIAGWLIGLYQNLLYYNMIPEALAPCTLGVSCTTQYIQWFGFVDIPQLSLVTFTFIVLAIYYSHKGYSKGQGTETPAVT